MDLADQRRKFLQVREGLAASSRLQEGTSVDPMGDQALVFLGKTAGDALFCFHSNFIHHLIRNRSKRSKSPIPDDDLFQEASFGLMKAISHFDPDRGVKFTTYAAAWIIQALMRAHYRWSLIKIPTYVHTRAVSDEKMGIGSRQDLPRVDVILDMHVKSDDPESITIMDVMSDPDAASPDDVVNSFEVADIIQSMVELLPERDQKIIHLRFFEDLSLQAIADDLSMTRENVRLIIKKNLNVLRLLIGNAAR